MRTDEKLQELCDRLEINCGDIHEAARYCQVSPNFVHAWIKDDPVAAEKLKESQRVGYGGLESEAIRRAVRGVEEDVYYKGQVVGYKTNYSDGLLGKLLEARIPEYSKKEGIGGNTFNAPVQINVMPRAESYEEWIVMREQTLKKSNAPSLPSPDQKLPEVLQGEYVELNERISELEGLGL